MPTAREKTVFNRRVAAVVAAVDVLAWLGVVLSVVADLKPGEDSRPALFLAPLFMLVAAFFSLPSSADDHPYDDRWLWAKRGLMAFAGMQVINVVVALVA